MQKDKLHTSIHTKHTLAISHAANFATPGYSGKFSLPRAAT
jgi:hypothetical protein